MTLKGLLDIGLECFVKMKFVDVSFSFNAAFAAYYIYFNDVLYETLESNCPMVDRESAGRDWPDFQALELGSRI